MEDKEYQVGYKLLCGNNSRELGIEDEEGNWSVEKFQRHISECKVCFEIAKKMIKEILKKRYNV